MPNGFLDRRRGDGFRQQIWGLAIGCLDWSLISTESAIRNIKNLIAVSCRKGSFNANQFAKSIFLFRNPSCSGAASPAQIVFNSPVCDALPLHCRSFVPEGQQKTDILGKKARRVKEIQIEHYNHAAHQLQPFNIGGHVTAQNFFSRH